MTTVWRRVAAMVAAIACGLMLALVGTAAADDRHDEDDKCARGEATGDGTSVVPGANLPFNRFVFDVCRTGPRTADVTGDFSAFAPLSAGAITVQGPVVCADFAEKTVSFLYTLNEKSTAGTAGTQILIVAIDGGPKGAGDKIGFLGFAPTVAFNGQCDVSGPQATLAKANALPLSEGDIEVTSKP